MSFGLISGTEISQLFQELGGDDIGHFIKIIIRILLFVFLSLSILFETIEELSIEFDLILC